MHVPNLGSLKILHPTLKEAMKLTDQEAKLFYQLMWSLQLYVNQKLKIISDIDSIDDYIELDMEDKMQVREALYKNSHLIDEYIQENPQRFSDEYLERIADWENFIADNFYIERLLKKHSIFIGSKNKVYAVYGIQIDIEDIVDKRSVPILVKAVLLPFAGKIIYDGVFQHHNIYFGSGVRGRLKETYLKAKQNNRIIETLDKNPPKVVIKPVKKWNAEFKKLSTTAKKLRSDENQPALHSPVFSLIKASIELGELATTDLKNIAELRKVFNRINRSLSKVANTLNRIE